jgi:hypothetical protein
VLEGGLDPRSRRKTWRVNQGIGKVQTSRWGPWSRGLGEKQLFYWNMPWLLQVPPCPFRSSVAWIRAHSPPLGWVGPEQITEFQRTEAHVDQPKWGAGSWAPQYPGQAAKPSWSWDSIREIKNVVRFLWLDCWLLSHAPLCSVLSCFLRDIFFLPKAQENPSFSCRTFHFQLRVLMSSMS